MIPPNSVVRTLTGEGRPRLIVDKADGNFWTSFGTTTYSDTTVTETAAATVNISSSATINIINTSAAHNLAVGNRVLIAGHSGTTPDINGYHHVTKVTDSDTVCLDVNFTGTGSSGTIRKVPDLTYVFAGMAVRATITRSGQPALITIGRITSVDRTNYIITVDKWIQGTPTSGNAYTVNGWVVDLPQCQRLTQKFAPEKLRRGLWRGRVVQKLYGYRYSALLDYSQYIRADAFIEMVRGLNIKENDRLTLIPHVDESFSYPVVIRDEIAISLFGIHGGHRDVVLAFEGTELVPFPSVQFGYGLGYGMNYGNQL